MLFYTSNTFVPINWPVEEADVVFVGIPLTDGSGAGCTRFGPLVVREGLKLVEDWDGKVHLFQKLKISDVGDIEVVPGSFEETEKRIIETIKEIREKNTTCSILTIGGNHLITLPLIKGIKPKTLVQLDAHSDFMKSTEYNHQTWAYYAEKLTNLVQIGVRTHSPHDRTQFSIDNFLEFVKRPVHLTIDMDVFDPCYVDVGFPEPNGLKPSTVFKIITSLHPETMDITEISGFSLKTGVLAAHCTKVWLSKIQPKK